MIIQSKEFEDGFLVIKINYSRSDHAGAGGCFQIVDLYLETDTVESISNSLNIDYGIHYFDIVDFLHDLKVDPEKVNYRVEVD